MGEKKHEEMRDPENSKEKRSQKERVKIKGCLEPD